MNYFCRQVAIAAISSLLLAGGSAYGQQVQGHNNFFGTLAFVGGAHLGARAALDLNTSKNWSVGVTYGFFTGYARDLPADYSQRYVYNGPVTLKDAGQYGALTLGRNFKLGSSAAWHNRVGPSFNSISVHENFQLAPFSVTVPLGSYTKTVYSSEKVYHFPIGLYLSTALEFSSKSGAGVTIGVAANLNPVRSMVGLDFGVLFGKRGTWDPSKKEH